MLLVALHGIRAGGSRLLARAAVVTPYVTAGLLFLAALWFVWPSLVSSAGNLEGALEQASWASLGLSFIAGLVFSFNPVSFAAIPVVLAYVTRAQDEKRALWLGGAFVGGLLVTHVLLGVASALGGEWVQQLLGRYWGAVLGPVLILLGLMWAGVLKLRLPWFSMRAKKVNGAGGAFLLAVPFSVAICPFCAPALLVVITASAAIGSVAYGAALLLAFALGRSIPILLGAWSMGWLESLGPLARHHRLFEVLGGIVLVLAGLYLMNSYFFWFDLGGMS
ncbi:MAG: cytochrome C biogenesis protein [Gammaproteobacteria bacterium]|nr:MAG: cytochrome C biogenesis protein [Gammaproteobacteria bacterium]RTZ76888.1 MAG: cytochrome C biogenesis protein [Gammaproteobacteria bacterium]